MRRKAAQLAREIRKGHPELNTRSISESIVEEARDRWTTEDNVKKCTAGWEAHLLVTGMAESLDDTIVNSKGCLQRIQILYPERIVNLDEKQANMCSDGDRGRRGNRLVDPLPPHTTPSPKSIQSQTKVHAANAAGKTFSPLFNFKSEATDNSRMKLSAGIISGLPRVMIKAGHNKVNEM